MSLDTLFSNASIAMTVISLATFVGILWWAFSARRKDDFEQASRLPFDDETPSNSQKPGQRHV